MSEREGNEQASHGAHCFDVFTAMSAALLAEVEKEVQDGK